jgi:hypothetical protein
MVMAYVYGTNLLQILSFFVKKTMHFFVSLRYYAKRDCFSLRRFISNTFGTVKAAFNTYRKLTYREVFQSL